MKSPILSRKRFLTLAAASGGAALLTSCDLLATDPEEEGGAESQGSQEKGKEAPMLAEQVQAGDLRPVEERLPTNPLVVEPFDRIGTYGGTWQTVQGSTDASWLWMSIVNEHLVKWDPTWSEFVPNVAESFEIVDDGREYVFQLREGLKWSDGQPFNADDLVFWYDAVFSNRELTPVISSQLSVDGEPLEVVKDDEYTVRFVFAKPYGLFLHYLAEHTPSFWLLPRHYLEQFHPDYNPDVDSLVEEAGVPDWMELFFQKMDELNNTERPVLWGWLPTNPHSDGDRQEWVRNPYYYKVDPDGSQLPYLDRVVYTFYQEHGPLLLEAANGNIDLYMRTEVTIPKNKPVLAADRERGGYELYDVTNANQNTIGVCLNLTHPDPDTRAMFQNKDFRIGLSHAINRQEIIDVVYQRQGEPWQTAPRPELPFYDSDDMAKQYTEFDLDLAAEHLDRAGYGELDGRGRRLDTNGRPISITVMVQTRYPVMADAMELVKSTWAEVGVELRIDNIAQDLFSTRIEANDYECALDTGELGYTGMISDPRWMFATAGSSYARLWSNWYEGGEPQEEPPEAMRRQIEIYRTEVMSKGTLQEQFEAFRKIIEIARDEFWTMGISLPVGEFVIVTNRMQNVQTDMWIAFKCPYPAAVNPSQFFIEEG